MLNCFFGLSVDLTKNQGIAFTVTPGILFMLGSQFSALGILGSVSDGMAVLYMLQIRWGSEPWSAVPYKNLARSTNTKPWKLEGRVWTWRRYSEVASGWRASRGNRYFSSPNCPDRLWAPPSLLSSSYLAFFSLAVNWVGLGSPSSTKVKNTWINTPISWCTFMIW